MHHSQRGFTLIELVMVIVILSILAAVALPKFADLRTGAHNAKHNGVGGGIAAAVNVTHAGWLAAGATGGTVTLQDGTVIGVGPEGWPEDSPAAGDGTATAGECAAMWNGVLQTGAPAAAIAAGAGIDYVASVAADPNCVFTYQGDTVGRTITYDTDTGAVTIAP